MNAKAFSPSHITAFFEIRDKAKDIRKVGSRGSGICLSKGVISEVEVKEGKQKIEIFFNGKKGKAETTQLAVKNLIEDKNYSVKIKIKAELPISQGFGISAGGTLSSVLAIAKCVNLNLSYWRLVSFAHESEVICKTGLGDVVSQAIGGIEIRKKEGIPPFGIIENISGKEEILVCTIGKEIYTKEILASSFFREKINFYGRKCLRQLIKNPTLNNLMDLSYKFAKETNLVSKEVHNAIKIANKHGKASVCMLGNSLFAIGDIEKIAEALKEFKPIVCKIGEGAKVL